MAVSVVERERNIPGGTIRWGFETMVASNIWIAFGTLCTIVLTSPTLLLASWHPLARIAYVAFVITAGISVGGVFYNNKIQIRWPDTEEQYRRRSSDSDRGVLGYEQDTFLLYLFGALQLVAIVFVGSAVFLGVFVHPLLALVTPFIGLELDRLLYRRYQQSLSTRGVDITRWLIKRYTSPSVWDLITLNKNQRNAKLLLSNFFAKPQPG